MCRWVLSSCLNCFLLHSPFSPPPTYAYSYLKHHFWEVLLVWDVLGQIQKIETEMQLAISTAHVFRVTFGMLLSYYRESYPISLLRKQLFEPSPSKPSLPAMCTHSCSAPEPKSSVGFAGESIRAVGGPQDGADACMQLLHVPSTRLLTWPELSSASSLLKKHRWLCFTDQLVPFKNS